MTVPTKLIRSEEEYDTAIKELGALFEVKPEPGTPIFDQLELLGLLVETYEIERCPVSPPDPVEAIRFYMDQNGFTVKDLGEVLHSRLRASDILNRKRDLNLSQIRTIHAAWSIPYDVLMQEPTSR